jgi:predicted MPP superfamily phosphohydrolase
LWVRIGLGAGVAAYASLVERNWYRLRRVVVPVLAPGAAPLRILHVSDVHMTPGPAPQAAGGSRGWRAPSPTW